MTQRYYNDYGEECWLSDDRELLRLVTTGNWKEMRAFREATGANFAAKIEEGDYPDCAYDLNVGMMALHFAVRDHAPIDIVREIYEAYPEALFEKSNYGRFAPTELLERKCPNTINTNYTEDEYLEVKAYLASLQKAT